jgi:thiol:disulfide interchange protein DsbD
VRATHPWGIALAASLVLLGIPSLSAGDDFLPADKAFLYLVESDGSCLRVTWHVAPGYYLYKGRMRVESGTPGVTLGEATYPAGERHHDEYFGEQEVFRDDFTVNVPLLRENPAATELTVRLHWQGCADAGLCYPPTTWESKLSLSATP